ncbi:MAG: sigma-70 family RNA polymerase sigma factor [Kofleriaceae bacterium]
MSADDHALAQAAARGDAAAIAAFEAKFAPAIDNVCRRFASTNHGEDDLRQILRDKLFVGGAPALATYDGRGSLGTWVKVIATRLFIDLGRRKDRARELADDVAIDRAFAPEDLGLEVIKAEYRDHVMRALRDAVAALDRGARHLLRQHLVSGLSIDQLAASLGIHRATAARRIAAAREQLIANTRDRLATTLEIDEHELAEMFALVISKLELSMKTLLATPKPT